MKKNREVLAIDYGASSGRGMLGSFSGERLSLKEICRFSNEPVQMGHHMFWDFPRLLHELGQAIRMGVKESQGGLSSLAIDTWGVDFGLLDRDGNLVGLPYHYRDNRTDGIMDLAFQHLPAEQLYAHSGIQLMQINTVFQLYAMLLKQSPQLEIAKKLLFTPDLFNYFLTGQAITERTIASTSGLLDAHSQGWSKPIAEAVKLPCHLYTDLTDAGTVTGTLSAAVQSSLNVSSIPVIAGASHDTAAAVVSVPTQERDFVYISCGTWSLLGTELDAPIINEESYRLSFTNESGAQGKIRFLKNIMGLWLIQECRRRWVNEGDAVSYEQLQQMAAAIESPGVYVDPDDGLFLSPEDMPGKIVEYVRHSGQRELSGGKAEMTRCILESLALKYRYTLESLERLTGKHYSVIHMVGGGIQNRLLCRLTADITGRTVVAGPVEATSIGNMLVQLMALGEVSSLSDMRQIVARSYTPDVYEPKANGEWETEYSKFVRLCNKDHTIK